MPPVFWWFQENIGTENIGLLTPTPAALNCLSGFNLKIDFLLLNLTETKKTKSVKSYYYTHDRKGNIVIFIQTMLCAPPPPPRAISDEKMSICLSVPWLLSPNHLALCTSMDACNLHMPTYLEGETQAPQYLMRKCRYASQCRGCYRRTI